MIELIAELNKKGYQVKIKKIVKRSKTEWIVRVPEAKKFDEIIILYPNEPDCKQS